MKKWIALVIVLAAAASISACSQGTPTSTAVAPQSSTLTAAVGESRSNKTPVLLCHHAKGGDPEWLVIEVDNNSVKVKGHLRHGDFTTDTCGGLSGLTAGEDCGCCEEGGLHPCEGPI